MIPKIIYISERTLNIKLYLLYIYIDKYTKKNNNI